MHRRHLQVTVRPPFGNGEGTVRADSDCPTSNTRDALQAWNLTGAERSSSVVNCSIESRPDKVEPDPNSMWTARFHGEPSEQIDRSVEATTA